MIRKKSPTTMDWLSLETRVRSALRDYYSNKVSAEIAIEVIDTVIGEETLRGFESDFDKYNK